MRSLSERSRLGFQVKNKFFLMRPFLGYLLIYLTYLEDYSTVASVHSSYS